MAPSATRPVPGPRPGRCSSASPPPPGPGSRARSPRRLPPRSAPGRRSPRRARAGRRPHRLGQDARRLPLGARPARRHAATRGATERCRVLYVSPLKALAVDVERNLRAPLVGIRQTAQPARPARCPSHGRRPLRRHPRRASAGARADPAGHPDHHAGVALPDAHVAGARVAARRRDGHRRRGPRGRRDQARCPPRAVAGAARRAARTQPRAADRPVRDGAPARGGRPVPRRPRHAGRASCSRPRARRSTSRSSSRSTT